MFIQTLKGAEYCQAELTLQSSGDDVRSDAVIGIGLPSLLRTSYVIAVQSNALAAKFLALGDQILSLNGKLQP